MDQLFRKIRFLGYIMMDPNRALAPTGAVSDQFKRFVSAMLLSSSLAPIIGAR
ncbi:hypothetical protein [Sphingobium agri]|uniref:Uncharacterized protein n=1 Tax=Sphingobium agri TaxID=2933566 RepID=A0ABT0DUL0_9SPHN|nr:hypothetical protein [Sphingobium agri]